jgi:glucose-1-phosphatase
VPFSKFADAWNSIYLDAYPGISELIQNLKKYGSVIALTNTNSIHSPVWKQRYASECRLFERIYSSHEIGVRKPHIGAFESILCNYPEIARERVAFVDDTAANAQAALSTGLFSLQADPEFGLQSVADDLLGWARE